MDEILLVSTQERTARRIPFDPRVTVIRGGNDTGKSSIIKSIFWTFGCKPKINATWKAATIQSLVHFRAEDRPYSIARVGNTFGVFRESRLVACTSSVSELGECLSDVFDFRLQLSDKNDGTPVTPPPAFFFLPFYIDQDTGWTDNYNSFSNLRQFKNARKDVAEYHTGIFPNSYYLAKSRKAETEIKLQRPLEKERVLREIARDLEQRFKHIAFDLDIEDFRLIIDQLLVRAADLKTKQDQYRLRIVDLRNERDELEAQRLIVQRAKAELEQDYGFATSSLPDKVPCPTCGHEYENDIISRFGLAYDGARCIDELAHLIDSIGRVDRSISKEQDCLAELTVELREVDDLLAVRKQEITLGQLIENEGRRGFRNILASDMARVGKEIADLESTIREVKEQMKRLGDPQRRREIVDEYASLLDRLRTRLNVAGLPEGTAKRVDAKIDQTGSDMPRALLAFYLAIWNVIASHGSSLFAPIVIDAINQQEQDRPNLRRMIEAIRDCRPEGSQTIIGVVDPCGIEFPGTTVTLTDKHHVLSKDEYSATEPLVRPYIERIVG